MQDVVLEASERRFRALTEKAQILTIVCNAQGQVSYVSPASRQLLGKDPQGLLGSNIFDWIHPDDRAAARLELAEVVAFRNAGDESIVRFGHTDGSWRFLAALANNCLSDSAVAGIVLNFRDVTGRKRAEEALQRLADHDPLLCPSKSEASRGSDVPVFLRAILKSAPCAAWDGAQTR